MVLSINECNPDDEDYGLFETADERAEDSPTWLFALRSRMVSLLEGLVSVVVLRPAIRCHMLNHNCCNRCFMFQDLNHFM